MIRLPATVFLTATTLLLLLLVMDGRTEDKDVGDRTNTAVERAALAAVARRIDSYNRHDVEAYLAAHHEKVQIYEYPDKVAGRGRSHLRRIFAPLLERGIGSVRVRNQTVIANTVISEEYVAYGGNGEQHVVALYTVEDDLITSYRLIESPN